MPLSHLAAVELQLVMQCLDRRSLLALARCSRLTLAAASSDFAWRCLPPVDLEFTPSTLDLGPRLSSSLLRFCHVHVRWTGGDQQGPVSEEEMSALVMVQRMRSLDCEARWSGDQDGWVEQALERLPPRSLTSLRLGAQDPLPLVRLVARQPLLTALSFWPSLVRSEGAAVAELSVQLASAPPSSLTHLTMHSPSAFPHTAAPLLLAACTRLRRLELRNLADVDVSSLLRHRSLASLEELRLACFATTIAAPVGERAPDFTYLGQLRSLSLEFVYSASKFLAALLLAASAGCPLLRCLSLSSVRCSGWLAEVTAADSVALRMLRRLEELTLSRWTDFDDGPKDLPLLLSSLPLLRRLCVHRCQQPDALVSAAAEHCGALESISVRVWKLDQASDGWRAEAPSSPVVQRALESCPRLTQFVMQLPALSTHTKNKKHNTKNPPIHHAHWHRVHSAWQKLAQQQPGRVRLELWEE